MPGLSPIGRALSRYACIYMITPYYSTTLILNYLYIVDARLTIGLIGLIMNDSILLSMTI